ncbi:MAG: DNA polymerase-3 subunit delta' [Verrucomicrobiales bacterium]|jgi:DNA polymerase-3 subunit delta'
MAFFPESALAYLTRAHADGRLAHAYLITGLEGTDREEFAVKLLQTVNQSTRSSLEEFQNEGVRIVAPESKSRRIKIEQMREIERSLYLGGVAPGKVKAGVVIDADRMTTEAINCFLKTLEEPPDGCLLLLLTQYPEQLLDTVRSRCISVALAPVPGETRQFTTSQSALLDALGAHFSGKLTTSRALALMRQFSAGLASIKSDISDQLEKVAKAESAHYKQKTEGDWLKRREDHFKALAEARYLQQRDRQLEILLLWLGDMLRLQVQWSRIDLIDYKAALESAAQNIPTHQLHQRLKAVEALMRHLRTNVSEPLALEVAFLNAFGPTEER